MVASGPACGWLADKWNGTQWLKIFGSLGDTLNNERATTFDNNQEEASSPFSSNIATVFAADANVYEEVKAALLALGVTSVNQLPIPAGGWGAGLPPAPQLKLAMGLEDEKNLFTMLLRIGVMASVDDRIAYMSSSPFSVLRVSRRPTAPAQDQSLFVGSVIDRTTTNTEEDLRDALEALVDAVKAHYSAGRVVQEVNSVKNLLGAQVDFGGFCYVGEVQCSGDNRDAYYSGTDPTVAFTQASDFNVVVGVNHQAFGTASYSNLVIYNGPRQVGVVGVTDVEYAGSAASFLAGTEYAGVSDYLYAYTFARDCTGLGDYCTVVPSTGWPLLPEFNPGTPQLSVAVFIDRAYVHPETHVGPHEDAILPPVQLRFSALPAA